MDGITEAVKFQRALVLLRVHHTDLVRLLGDGLIDDDTGSDRLNVYAKALADVYGLDRDALMDALKVSLQR